MKKNGRVQRKVPIHSTHEIKTSSIRHKDFGNAICENLSGYVWKSQVYTGQIPSNPEKNQGRSVVLELVQGLGPGFGVTCDIFFHIAGPHT